MKLDIAQLRAALRQKISQSNKAVRFLYTFSNRWDYGNLPVLSVETVLPADLGELVIDGGDYVNAETNDESRLMTVGRTKRTRRI